MQKKYGWLWKETTTINFDAQRKTFDIRRATCNYVKAQHKQQQIEEIQTFLKISPEYEGKTFADYDVDDNNAYAVKAAKYLIEHPDKGAFFYGTVGTGKTLLAAIIAQEIIKRGRQVIFATVPEISMQLRSTFNRVPKRDSTGENLIEQPLTESEILDRLINVPTLMLDDVGMGATCSVMKSYCA